METDEFGGTLVEPGRDEFGGVAVGQPPTQPAEQTEVPESFLHRLALGMMIGEHGQSPAELRAKGFEDFNVAANTADQFKAGLDRVKKGFQEPFTLGGTNISDVAMGAYQSLASPFSAAFQAIGGAGEKLTGGILTGDQINTALMIADGPPGTVARVRNGAPQVIGSLPTAQDFAAAGRVLDSPHAETNLRRMWQEDGIHPAEAVHDAQADAFLKHEITAPPTIVAYHGSPHDFNIFDLGHINSGEGSQSYGHGLYFAQEKNVAENYRDILSRQVPTTNGRIQATGSGKFNIVDDFGIQAGPFDTRENAELSLRGTAGNLYQVRIKADPNDFLDYDKPLNEQPAGVKEVFADLGKQFGPDAKMDSLLKILSSRIGGQKAVAERLQEAGVPGVKYLDSGSRSDGEGSRNYVAFDDKHVEITHKNGVPVETIPKEWNVKPEEMEQAFGNNASLSAAVTPPEQIPIAQQPPRPAGSLIASAQAAGEKLFDVGRDIQMKLAPMARGSVDSMATVKDYMNSMRRNAWDSSRIDTDIVDRFSAEQRERMARAMEEESLSLRLGEPESAREHQGLATLEPEERAAVEQLDQAQQLAWLRARDLGMVEGDGIPMHFPRMAIGAKGDSEIGKPPSLTQMYGIRKNSPFTKQRQYMEAEETEKALKAKYGDQAKIAWDIRAVNLATKMLEDAVAGRTLIKNIQEVGKRTGDETVAEGFKPGDGWFTVDHPAFQKWRPKLGDDGKAVMDSAAKPVFESVPIYVRGDFEGPIRAALWGKTGEAYQGMMALKGKTMGLIMNSPMIHNLVELGRAFPAIAEQGGVKGIPTLPIRVVKTYVDGYRAKNDVGMMHEAINAGLVPIGKRFFNQDINAIMEAPDLTPGRSFTAKVLSAVPGLFDEAAGTAVKQAIDKAGDFWHNTLLWDRIADLQMGLYTNFRGDLIGKGMDQQTASRIAAHWANRYAGALPKEAMSEAATKVSNFLFFSRSFTFGNLGVMKDMLTGLPKDVLAQIERDAGFRAGSIEGADVEGAKQMAVTSAKSIARRQAMMVVGLDVGLMIAGNSVLQSALNVFRGTSWSQEEHEYLRRFGDVINDVKAHPLSLLNPIYVGGIPSRLSATHENEPGKGDRVMIGTAKNGTAIYARNPIGKIGEEFTGYFDSPLDMMRKKEGTILRPLMQIYSNDAGFGRKIYDPHAETLGDRAGAIWAMAKHLVESQLPMGQLKAGHDLVTGDGDKFVNLLQVAGPLAGVTFSKGAPGGPAVGEMYDVKGRREFAQQQAMPDLRRQIQRGDIAGARSAMAELGMDASYQNWVIKTSMDPRLRLSPRSVRDFYRTASPEQRGRFDRAQGAPAQP